jgi:hypothetical protein
MRMDCAGRGNEKGRIGNGNDNCAGRGNEKIEQRMRMTEHGMTVYYLLP